MADNFGQSVREGVDALLDNIEEVVVATTLNGALRIIDGSPVDTGQFKGNWHASVDAEDEQVFEGRLDPTGSATLAALSQVIRDAGYGHVVHLQNNLVYAVPLENGHSWRQAPNGIVRITAQALPHVFVREARLRGFTIT